MNTLSNKSRNLSASALAKTGEGSVVGIVINSHTSGTIKLWDSLTAANTVLVNTITLAAGERFIPFYNLSFSVGLYVTIGGTADITVVYQ
jgi:hypothetical protein